MREFKKRRNKKQEVASFAARCGASLVLLVVTVMLAHAAWDMYSKMVAASKAQDQAQAELAQVQAQRSGVDATLTQITSDRGVEEQIRERYGVAKPGEGEIDVIRDTKATTTPVEPEESWWMKIFHVLFVW